MKIHFFYAALFLPFFLGGCWDKVEMNERAYVNAISVDKAESGEDSDQRFMVAVAITEPEEDRNDGGEDSKNVKKSVGRAVSSAIRQSESHMSRKLFFGYTKAVFLGEALLRDRELLTKALDAFERDRELSREMLLLAADCEASDIIAADPPEGPAIGFYVDNFYGRKNLSSTFRLTLEDLFIRIRSDGNAVIPKITAENEELEISGAAVLRGLELRGFLNEAETRGYLWQKGNALGAKLTTDYSGVPVSFTTLSHSKNIRFRQGGRSFVMMVEVDAEGSLDEYAYGKTVYNAAMLKQIETLIGMEIKKEIEAVNHVLIHRLKTDGLNASETLKKQNYNLWKQYPNWQEAFENMEYEVVVNTKIKSIGLIK